MTTAYRLDRPPPHTTTLMRREPLGAVPGWRVVCSCGESAWRQSEDRIAEWETGHSRLKGSM